MSLAERRRLRLFTLCVLYVAQGMPWGFMAYTLPPYLTARGVGAAEVGAVLGMTTLPYAFKWVWGPIIDTLTIPSLGRRRPWIVLAQGMMALTLGAIILIPDLIANLELLIWMIFVHTVFNALQDVAVDALAVDLLEEDERGRANGLMYASKYGGGLLGGAGMATVIDGFDLRTALIVQTALLLAIMLLPLLVRERPGAPPPRPSLREVGRGLLEAFSLRSTLLCAALLLGVNIGISMLSPIATVLFTKQLGWTDTDYAQLTGGLGPLLGRGGAVLGGFVADARGHRRLAAIGSLGLAACWIVFALGEPLWRDRTFVIALVVAVPVFQALMTVSLFALCMDVSWPRVGAIQFTAYMALMNFSSTIGYRFGGAASELWTYQGIYLVAAVIQLSVTLLLFGIDPGQTRRTLPRPAGTPTPPVAIGAIAVLLATLIALPLWVLFY